MDGSTYFLLALVVVTAMGLIGLGLLFVRATNIERTNMVAFCTLLGVAISSFVLINAGQPGAMPPDSAAWSAITISVLGFVIGRLLDVILGPRRIVKRDDATLGSDLAD